MWETWIRSLGRGDPLEKEMATHSSTLAWKVPWTELGGITYIVNVHVINDFYKFVELCDCQDNLVLEHFKHYKKFP